MKILDRHVITQLAFPILFCSCALMFLVLVSDLFDNLDEMLKNKTTIHHILLYYASLIPYLFVQTISWASLLGTIYVLASFNYHNEMIAMKCAGLEITSIIRPILLIGFSIGVITFLVNERLVPVMSRNAHQILEERIEKKRSAAQREVYENVTYYGGRDRLYYVRVFDANRQTLEHFTILWLDQKKKIRKKTIAREAVWTGSQWELHKVTDYLMERNGEILGEPSFQQTAVVGEIRETPEDFLRAARESATISYRELKDYVTQLRENGVKIDIERVALQHKLAFPWNPLAVMIMTIPLLAKTSMRRMIAPSVLLCLALVFGFHIFGAMMLALGKAGKLVPLLSAWSHHFLFGFGTFFFLDRANN